VSEKVWLVRGMMDSAGLIDRSALRSVSGIEGGSLEVNLALVPPGTPLVRLSVTLPTTTSTKPISLRLPLTTTMTTQHLLEQLTTELVLPRCTADLVAPSPGQRGRGKSRRTLSHSSSLGGVGSSEDFKSARTRPEDAVWWTVTLRDGGETRKIDTSDVLLEELRECSASAWLEVALDEEWLFEKARPGAKGEFETTLPKSALDGDEEEDDEEHRSTTLKATPSKSTTTLPDEPRSAPDSPTPATSFRVGPGSSRLSGLFHGWADAHKHPAPPPSPQSAITQPETSTVSAAGYFDQPRPRPIEVTERLRRDGRPMSVSGPVGDMAPDGGLTAGRRSSFAGEREVEQSPGDLSEADNVDPHEWESFLVCPSTTTT
jgi:hypothetical protein